MNRSPRMHMAGNKIAGPTLALLLSFVPASAAIDGTVRNATSGQPAPNVEVALVQPSQSGMNRVASVTSDSSGKFSFPQSPQGPTLVQAAHQGVTYSKMLMPGAPATAIELNIFDSTTKPVAKVAQHFILLQPATNELNVSETFLLQGDPKLTYNDPKGTLEAFIPSGVKGGINVQATGPSGMPLTQAAQKTNQPNVYRVSYPIKPGETRIDFAYTLPAGSPMTFSGKVLEKGDVARLVAPKGVSLKGSGIQEAGTEPRTQATIYNVTAPSFKVDISGTGSLQQDAEPASDEDAGRPTPEEAPPHIYRQRTWILVCTLTILGLGTFLLARRPAIKS